MLTITIVVIIRRKLAYTYFFHSDSSNISYDIIHYLTFGNELSSINLSINSIVYWAFSYDEKVIQMKIHFNLN